MKTFLRFVLVFIMLLAAMACYSKGFETGAFIFILLGIGFEAGFWFGLFPPKKRSSSS